MNIDDIEERLAGLAERFEKLCAKREEIRVDCAEHARQLEVAKAEAKETGLNLDGLSDKQIRNLHRKNTKQLKSGVSAIEKHIATGERLFAEYQEGSF